MRVFNRLAALLLGLVLLAGGLLVVVEAVLAASDRRPWPVDLSGTYHALRTTALSSSVFLACCIAAIVVGVVLFIAEVRRWTPTTMAARDGGPDLMVQVADPSVDRSPTSWWLYRRSVEHEIDGAVSTVSGADAPRTRLRGRRAKWKLAVNAEGRPDTSDSVERAVRDELTRMAAPEQVKLRVSMRKPRRVV